MIQKARKAGKSFNHLKASHLSNVDAMLLRYLPLHIYVHFLRKINTIITPPVSITIIMQYSLAANSQLYNLLAQLCTASSAERNKHFSLRGPVL